jgi:hypothetical protein
MDNDKIVGCKIKAVIGANIALILFGGCGYNQTSNDHVINTEDAPNVDKTEDDSQKENINISEAASKEDNINITEASWEDGYTIVLNAYREEAEKISENGLYWDSFDEIPAIPNVEDAKIETEFYNQFGPYAFMLKDLDGNEIPELFICRATEEYESGVIYNIFTWHDGKTIELLGNLGYRSGICTICQDNLLKVEASGTGTDYGNTILYLPENSTELKRFEEFYAIQNEEDSKKSDFFWLSPDGEKTPITKEQYVEYVQNYVEQADLRYIEGTQDNIAHISDLWDE